MCQKASDTTLAKELFALTRARSIKPAESAYSIYIKMLVDDVTVENVTEGEVLTTPAFTLLFLITLSYNLLTSPHSQSIISQII